MSTATAVQTISDATIEIYKKLQNGGADFPEVNNADFTIIKSMPQDVLISLLELKEKSFKSENMKENVKDFIKCVRGMAADGTAKLSALTTDSQFEKDLDCLCIVVRKRKNDENIVVCDSFIATYSYKQNVDTQALLVGCASAFSAAALAALGVYGTASGEVSKSVAGVAAISASVVPAAVAAKSFDNLFPKIEANHLPIVLEATLIHQIVQRGHGLVKDDKTLVLTDDH